jgi:choice-of-anchor A domain-containing protein
MIRSLSRSFIRSFLLPVGLVASTVQGASADITGTLSNFNLITTGSVADNSDVAGRVIIGGTLSGNNFAFGGQLGNFAGISGTTNGVFNTISGTISNFNGNNIANTFYATNDTSNTFTNASKSPSQVASFTGGLSTYLTGLATSYGNLAANSTFSVNSANSTITFAASAPSTGSLQNVAVFSIPSSFFTNSSLQNFAVSLTGLGANQTAIINVTGVTAQTFTNNLSFSDITNLGDSAHILFNFGNSATSLSGLPPLGGSILAPDASLTSNGVIVGGVYVASLSDQQFEIDLPSANGAAALGFTGFTPSVVPEPASLAMILVGGGMAGGYALNRRRRARKAAAIA